MISKDYTWPKHFRTAVTPGPPLDAARLWTSLLASDTGMKVNITTTVDGSNKYKWLRNSTIDVIIGGVIEIGPMPEGKGRFANRDTGPFPIRALWAAAKGNEGFFVRGDSYIKTIYDIKPGVRIVDMSGYLATRRVLEAFLSWSGNIKDFNQDVKWIPANNSSHKVNLVIEGKADVAFAIPTSPEIFEAEKNPFGLRWIDLNAEIDPEGARRFYDKHPLVDFGKMFNGVSSCIGHWGMIGTGLFCCCEDSNIDFVYNLAKWMNENRNRYKDLHFRLAYMSLETLLEQIDTTFVPFHDGLIKYLRELGQWTKNHEQRQKMNAEMVNQYFQASQEAMALADKKRIAISQENSEWITLWKPIRKSTTCHKFKGIQV